jgi:hypothetical protein
MQTVALLALHGMNVAIFYYHIQNSLPLDLNKAVAACLFPLTLLQVSSSFYDYIYIYICGPGSPVGIATGYGLDGPGSNPGWDEIFRPSRPALGPTQPPVQWAPGLSRG